MTIEPRGRAAALPKATTMANTTSAKKATRKIARRTEVNKTRRSRMRSFVRKVEEAIAAGDRTAAAQVLREAEPEIMRAAQKGVLHRSTASRKVSRLSHQVAKLGA
jgi:small subunit ribosomal protein S20